MFNHICPKPSLGFGTLLGAQINSVHLELVCICLCTCKFAIWERQCKLVISQNNIKWVHVSKTLYSFRNFLIKSYLSAKQEGLWHTHDLVYLSSSVTYVVISIDVCLFPIVLTQSNPCEPKARFAEPEESIIEGTESKKEMGTGSKEINQQARKGQCVLISVFFLWLNSGKDVCQMLNKS